MRYNCALALESRPMGASIFAPSTLTDERNKEKKGMHAAVDPFSCLTALPPQPGVKDNHIIERTYTAGGARMPDHIDPSPALPACDN